MHQRVSTALGCQEMVHIATANGAKRFLVGESGTAVSLLWALYAHTLLTLCLVILGGGGSNWPPGILADPPTHPRQKIFPQEKNEIYQRGPNLEANFRYTNFFLASDPPTPPPPPV